MAKKTDSSIVEFVKRMEKNKRYVLSCAKSPNKILRVWKIKNGQYRCDKTLQGFPEGILRVTSDAEKFAGFLASVGASVKAYSESEVEKLASKVKPSIIPVWNKKETEKLDKVDWKKPEASLR